MAFITIEDTTGAIESIVFPKTLMEKPAMFYEGNVVLIRGRISMREDKETKIVCESIEPCLDESSIPEKKQEKKKDNRHN